VSNKKLPLLKHFSTYNNYPLQIFFGMKIQFYSLIKLVASHGALKFPVSRNMMCIDLAYGGEDVKTCNELYDLSYGPTIIYDWDGFSQLADGRIYKNYPENDPLKAHREIMNSNICSANIDKLKAALQTNLNWLAGASVIRPGSHVFEYKVSVPHKTSLWNGMLGYVDFYITSDSR